MQGQSSHAPLASLAAHWQACEGDIPPPLVGASVTLVDDGSDAALLDRSSSSSSKILSCGRIYLFGGRLVTTRRMVNDMYVLDLATLHWTRHPRTDKRNVEHGSASQSKLPQPRYFHSCDLWNGKLIIFGGMGYVQGNDSELCVLNEVVAFDLKTQDWDLEYGITDRNKGSNPEPRYAHLSSTTANSLVIVGGQDMANHYVETINIFDLEQRQWTISQEFGKQRGSYRSLAVGPAWIVDDRLSGQDLESSSSSQGNGFPSPLSTSNLYPLPTSKKKWDDQGKERRLPIYVYTNYNFTDVKREMEVVKFNTAGRNQSDEEEDEIKVVDESGSMNGVSLPPGLRFPMGAILGNYLLISGTYLANTSQTFAIWALYLPKMTWTRLDVGPLLSTGSWNRGILWPGQSRLLIFGHRERDLVSDYNHRQTNWDHVLILELEAWGITQPPIEKVSYPSIQFGLQKLASSVLGSLSHSLPSQSTDEEGVGGVGVREAGSLALGGQGDFDIVCSDGLRIGCDRAILEKRWPWFASKLQDYRQEARRKAQRMYRDRSGNDSRQSNQVSDILEDVSIGSDQPREGNESNLVRITPRQLVMGESSPVVLSLLIFFYTQCICTTFQRHPAMIAALLVLSKVYNLPELEEWAKHAAHVSLASDLSPPSNVDAGTPTSATIPSPALVSQHYPMPPLERHRLAVSIYEAATMCGFEALQIRSLRTVMSIAKWVQRSSMMSHKSSFNVVDLNGDISAAQTPTTSALFPEGVQSSISDSNTMVASPIRSSLTSATASPASYKRLSIGKGGEAESMEDAMSSSTNMARRPSKAERMLGMSGADFAASKLGGNGNATNSRAEKGIVGEGGGAEIGRRNTVLGNNGGPPLLPPSSQPPVALNNIRRPSAPASSGPPPSAMMTNLRNTSMDQGVGGSSSSSSSTGGKKRFSIFGRTSDVASKQPPPPAALGHQVAGDGQGKGETLMVEEGREGIEQGHLLRSLPRLNASATRGGDDSSNQSTTSLHPNTIGEIGTLPPPAFSEKEMRRIERESGKGGKMATLTRLKANALKSIDTTYSQNVAHYNKTNIGNVNNSTNGVNLNVHRPIVTQQHSSSVAQSIPSSHTEISNGSGKLNDKELKALYSIWS